MFNVLTSLFKPVKNETKRYQINELFESLKKRDLEKKERN